MTTLEFVYTTYIKTTPQRLWRALTDPDDVGRYWGVTLETDWTPGSAMVWSEQGTRVADPGQVVLEATPHRRLSYTGRSFTPDVAKAFGLGEDIYAALARERRSTLTFDIEPAGETVKLTLTIDCDPAGTLYDIVSQGWPRILSNLKTLLETGDTLPAHAD
ncbi:MAG: SRPBCC family protein [Kutzneria sp.]|nr:SRPBCC family protein [Kutzneria sp.]MBV9844735.1 SRPBCC family protein [Kutzneria sp.]